MAVRAPFVLGLCLGICAPACGEKGAKKIPRDEDAAAVVVVDRTPGGAELTDEVEPNDVAEKATVVELGGGGRGALDGEDDTDYFRVTVAEAGLLEAVVGGLEEIDLILDVRDEQGERLVRSDRGPEDTAEGVPNFPVEPGVYHIAISEFVGKSERRNEAREKRTGPSAAYQLTVRWRAEPEQDHEPEPNSDADGAGEMLVTDEHVGFIGWHEDVDMWKLSLEGFTSHYGLDFDLTGVPGVWLRLEILDSGGKRVLLRKADRGEPIAIRGLAPAEGQSHYYVKIFARRSNPEEPYRIEARTRLLDLDEEMEPNDTVEDATALRESSDVGDGRRRGHLAPGDVDLYRLDAVEDPVLLTIAVEPPSGLDVAVKVRSAGGDELGGADGGETGAREELVGLPVPAGTELIVEVSGSGSDEEPYELRWSAQPDDSAAPEPELDDPFEE